MPSSTLSVCIEPNSNIEDSSTRSTSLNAVSDQHELCCNFIKQGRNYGKFSEKKLDQVSDV